MPVKTKQLVAMGSYIKYCRTTFMDKAKARILKSIRLAIQLMDFTSLSEEQLYLNASIVNWLKRIKPIFEEYNDVSFILHHYFLCHSQFLQFFFQYL